MIGVGDGRERRKTNQSEVFPIAQIRRAVQVEGGVRRKTIQRRLINFELGDGRLIEEIRPHFAHPQDRRDRRRSANIDGPWQRVVRGIRIDLIRMLDLHERGRRASAPRSDIEADSRRFAGHERSLKRVRLEENVTRARAEPEIAKIQGFRRHIHRDSHAGGYGRAEVAHPHPDHRRNAILRDRGRLEQLHFEIGLRRLHGKLRSVVRQRPHRGLVNTLHAHAARCVAGRARNIGALPNEVLPRLQRRKPHE